MKFRYPKVEEKNDIENLWAYCFETKDDPFFKFYFKECYDQNSTLVGTEIIDDEEDILAMVHLRPYNISLRNKAMEMAYIVGVATNPTVRRSGVGREILVASLEELRKKGHALSILMPSMAGFYQPYGWELYCHQWLRRVPLEKLRKIADRSLSFKIVDINNKNNFTKAIVDMSLIYNSYTENLTGYAIRDNNHWQRLITSVSLEGLNIVIAYEDNNPVGYMFYKLGEPEIIVPEMIYSTRKGQKALLGYIYNHRSQGISIRWNEGFSDNGYIFYPNGQEGNEVLPFMMSRVVDVEKALVEIPLAETEDFNLTISVIDPLVEWNTGIFTLSYRNGKKEISKVEYSEKIDIKIEVGALGLILFGKLTASELAFEGKILGDKEAIKLLDKLYPKELTFINEWY